MNSMKRRNIIRIISEKTVFSGLLLLSVMLHFPASATEKTLQSYGALQTAGPIVCDGKLDEAAWKNAVPIDLFTRCGLEGSRWKGGGEKDLSARAKLLYDSSSLYIAVEVLDNKHFQPHAPAMAWNADSVQIALDPLRDGIPQNAYDGNDREYTFALISGKPAYALSYGGAPGSKLPAPSVGIIRSKDKTVYEIAIPFAALSPAQGIPGKEIGVNILVNDDDGAGRKGYLQWTNGVGTGKEPALFANVILLGKDAADGMEVFSMLCPEETSYPRNRQIAIASYVTVNAPGKYKKVFTVEKAGKVLVQQTGTLQLAKGRNLVLSRFPANCSGGTLTLTETFFRNGTKLAESGKTIAIISESDIADRLANVLARKKALDQKIAALAAKGFDTSIATAASTVVKVTVPYIKGDISTKEFAEAEHSITCLEETLDEAEKLADGVLSGKQKDIRYPQYINTGLVLKDGFYHKDGKPVVLLGVMGDYLVVKNLMDPAACRDFADLGFNVTEFIDNGPQNFRKSPRKHANVSASDANGRWTRYETKDVLDAAKRGNLAATLLFSIHQFPRDFFKKYPDARSCGQIVRVNNFHADLPCQEDLRAREIYADWLKDSISLVKDHPSLIAYDMANELTFFDIGNSCKYCQESFRKYLQEKYKSPAPLNALWKTDHSAFSKITPPVKRSAKADFVDWEDYWHSKNANFFKWMRSVIKSADPALPVFIEKHGKTAFDSQKNYYWAMDFEQLGDAEDIAGIDAVSFWEDSHGYGNYAMDWRSQAMTYDLLKSFHPDHPIVNSEYHFAQQKAWQKSHPEKMPRGYARSTCYLGVIHGLAAGILWMYSDEWQPGNLDNRREYLLLSTPDALFEYGKTALELRKLAPYLAPFSARKSRIFILRTVDSLNRDSCNASLKQLYEALYFNGMPVRFISERQLAEGKLPANALLAVPADTRVQKEQLDAIEKHLSSGGSAAVIGKNALQLDKYGRSNHFSSAARAVSQNGRGKLRVLKEHLSTTQYEKALAQILRAENITPEILLTDAKGNPARQISYGTAQLPNGEKVFYMINLSRNAQRVKLQLPAGTGLFCLIKEEAVQNNFELQPMDPQILRLQTR